MVLNIPLTTTAEYDTSRWSTSILLEARLRIASANRQISGRSESGLNRAIQRPDSDRSDPIQQLRHLRLLRRGLTRQTRTRPDSDNFKTTVRLLSDD